MTVLLVFGVVLLMAVLLSALAQRTILSTAVLFLVSGFLCGPGVLHLVDAAPQDPVVARFAELALISILFVDGVRLGASDLRTAWRLPGRALLLGLPLTLVLTALLAHLVAGAGWADAWLVAAALSPTDPVFAVALIGHSGVPARLRHLLNVESGLNDGLALPIVVSLLAVRGAAAVSPAMAIGDVALGVAIGLGVAWVAVSLRTFSLFDVTKEYAPIGVFAVGTLALGCATALGANEFLATFVAGVVLAVRLPQACDVFEPFGSPLSEILKLAALLLFGAAISPGLILNVPASVLLFAALALAAARPIGIVIALAGSELTRRETAAAAWFGPKGFASVFFALLILKSGVPHADSSFRLIAITIVMSMIAHASTDVVVARWFTSPEFDDRARVRSS